MSDQSQCRSEVDVAGQTVEINNVVELSSQQISLDRCQLEISKIQVSACQPRRFFDPQKLEQLAQSIKTHGILENILVRPLADGDYELVAGERRLRAALIAELDEVPVTVRRLTDEQALNLAMIENLQRTDLNPIEETEGVLKLLTLRLDLKTDEVVSLLYRLQNEVKGKTTHNIIGSPQFYQLEAMFLEIGRFTWESFTVNRLPLLKMPSEILDLVRSGKISYTKAQAIARVKDKSVRQTVLNEALDQGLSLGKIRQRIQGSLKSHVSEPNLPKELFARAYQKIQSSKIWEDPEKWERVRSLLDELTSLLNI